MANQSFESWAQPIYSIDISASMFNLKGGTCFVYIYIYIDVDHFDQSESHSAIVVILNV